MLNSDISLRGWGRRLADRCGVFARWGRLVGFGGLGVRWVAVGGILWLPSRQLMSANCDRVLLTICFLSAVCFSRWDCLLSEISLPEQTPPTLPDRIPSP